MSTNPPTVPQEALHCDESSATVFLDVDRKDIVFFQGLFESYEGVGTVRTMEKSTGLVTILSTPDMLQTVVEILSSLPAEVSWRFASHLHQDEKSRYVNSLT